MVDQTDNFVRGSTDSSVTTTDTTVSVVDADEFPDPTAGRGEYNLVFWNDANGRPDQDPDAEIIRVTGRDTTADSLTVQRGQETTTAASHPSKSALQLAPTAKVIDDIVAEKADTDRAVEDFTTGGASGTIPISQGGGSLAMNTLAGRYDTVDVFETDGTFDATDIDTVFVECVGGGGGGGDVIDNGVDTLAIAGCGGGGGYAASYVDVSSTSSVSITVGTGGSAGGAGTDSSFGTAPVGGGGGAGVDADNNQPNGGSGGGGTGDITISGGSGARGATTSDSYTKDQSITSGGGGDSILGYGSQATHDLGGGIQGINGNKYGGGGGGAVNGTGSTGLSLSGGSGGDGVVIVHY